MQAKRYLNRKDIEDKRAVFIKRFKSAEIDLVSAQSFCTNPLELSSLNIFRVKLDDIKKKYSN